MACVVVWSFVAFISLFSHCNLPEKDTIVSCTVVSSANEGGQIYLTLK